jgi:hypothetical protein
VGQFRVVGHVPEEWRRGRHYVKAARILVESMDVVYDGAALLSVAS